MATAATTTAVRMAMRRLRRLLRRGGMSSGRCSRYMAVSVSQSFLVPPPNPRVLQRPLDRLKLLEGLSGPGCDAGEWRLGELGRDLALLAHALREAVKEPPAARQGHPSLHQVAGQLGGSAVEGVAHRGDDLVDRLVEGVADVLGIELYGLRPAGAEIAPADLDLDLIAERRGRTRLVLDVLSGLVPDQQLMLALAGVDDGVVHLVAADPDRLRDDDVSERDHGD